MSAPFVLRLSIGLDTLVIGPHARLGGMTPQSLTGRPAVHSKEEVRHLLLRALSDPGAGEQLRQALRKWTADTHRIATDTDRALVDRVAQLCAQGSLEPFVLTGLGGAKAPAQQSVRASGGAGSASNVGSMDLAAKIEETLKRVPDHLTGATKEEFKKLLTPEALAMMVGVFVVWIGGHAFGVSEIVDIVLLVAGVFFIGFAIKDVVSKLGQVVTLIGSARNEADLDKAAGLLAEVVAIIGVAAFIALITHAAAKGSRAAMPAKKPSVRGSPPERQPPPERLQERPVPDPAAEQASTAAKKAAADAVAEKAAIENAAAQKAAVSQKMAELGQEGHGPQRHEGQVTEAQLEARARLKQDPETGTRQDKYKVKADGTPANHSCGDHATKINSEEAYVKAEKNLRETQSFKDQAAAGEDRIAVDKPLEEVFGPDYKAEVSGKSRTAPWPDTTSPTTPTNFEDGKIQGFYERDPATGNYNLKTMYPEPKR